MIRQDEIIMASIMQSTRFNFRAWHPVDKEMCKVDGWQDDMNGRCFDIYRERSSDNIKTYEPLILMQQTGMLDLKGKEIFEGDIVCVGPGQVIDEIIFTSGCFCLKKALVRSEATYWGNGKSSDLLIVGNVYENPELLAGDNN